MKPVVRLLASQAFSAIAGLRVVDTWVPARDSLQGDEARVTRIASRSNAWRELEITPARNTLTALAAGPEFVRLERRSATSPAPPDFQSSPDDVT